MNNKSYMVVVPYYNDYNNLCLLLQDIARTNQRFKPEKILIIDDGSDKSIEDISNKYNISLLPDISIKRTDHLGVKNAINIGLNQVDSDYAIILHSDTRLLSPNTNSYVHKDVLSVLFYHCSDVEDAMTVSCFSLSDIDGSTSNDYVSRGFRHVNINHDEKFISIPYNRYRFASLKTQSHIGWFRVLSVSDNIFTLNMNLFREIDGFDNTISEYGYYLDDFLGKSRSKGYHTYFTYDTVAFHERQKKKSENSLAVYKQEDFELFCNKWINNDIWKEVSLWREVSYE